MDDSTYSANDNWPSSSQQSDYVPDATTKRSAKPTNLGVSQNQHTRIPLGLTSFNANDRYQFGQSIRLAMALIEPRTKQQQPNHQSTNVVKIAKQLKDLGRDINANIATQLELLVKFDEATGWKASGARHCVAWMNLELGISMALGWEYLRVGRKLRDLPICMALFKSGQLTWSKIRFISRVASTENEGGLCHAALDASASDVERICNEYRWQEIDTDSADTEAENKKALQQWESRSFTWSKASNGNTLIKLCLPPELAQAFLNSVEHSLSLNSQNDDSNSNLNSNNNNNNNKINSMQQRRADAAVLMAESSLQNAGREIAAADRYQVHLSVTADELTTPTKRPTVAGAGPVARETARRIACDCSVSTVSNVKGEPTNIGRKTRVWPSAMARTIKERDQHCQFPGCTMSQHLHIHHIEHWADGGSTSVENGCCLCSYHHTLVHEGGYRIALAANNEPAADKQFNRQQSINRNPELIETLLRNSRASFDFVKSLSPTRFRFRVVDSKGRDVRDSTGVDFKDINSTTVDSSAVDYARHYGSLTKSNIAEASAHYGYGIKTYEPLKANKARINNYY